MQLLLRSATSSPLASDRREGTPVDSPPEHALEIRLGNDDHREALIANESDGYGTDDVMQTLGSLAHYNHDRSVGAK
jgi:hypothetical protein